MRRTLRLLFSGLLPCLASCRHGTLAPSAAAAPHPATACGPLRQADSLPELIALRLELAREVAWTKFHSGAPIHDPSREAAILAGLVAQGRALGLDAAAVETFFSAQLAASREVQRELIAAWRSGAVVPSRAPLDLAGDIRPQLDALTPRLLALLPASLPLADATARTLAARGFSPTVIVLATAPLRP